MAEFKPLSIGIDYVSTSQPQAADGEFWADVSSSGPALLASDGNGWYNFSALTGSGDNSVGAQITIGVGDPDYVAETAPSSGNDGDIWVEVSGSDITSVHVYYDGSWIEHAG